MKKSVIAASLSIAAYLYIGCSLSYAQSVNIMANEFAREAGTIAGTVQACGTTITEYNSRVLEAINTLAKTPQERQQALTLYMGTLTKTQDLQSRTHPINCSEAVQSYQQLPLMKADYKTRVLPQLAAINNPGSASASLPPAAAAPNPVMVNPAATNITSNNLDTGKK